MQARKIKTLRARVKRAEKEFRRYQRFCDVAPNSPTYQRIREDKRDALDNARTALRIALEN